MRQQIIRGAILLGTLSLMIAFGAVAWQGQTENQSPRVAVEINGTQRTVVEGDRITEGMTQTGELCIPSGTVKVDVELPGEYTESEVKLVVDHSSCALVIEDVAHKRAPFVQTASQAWTNSEPVSYLVTSVSKMSGEAHESVTKTWNDLVYRDDGSQITWANILNQNCGTAWVWWSIDACNHFNETDTPTSGSVESSTTGEFSCASGWCDSDDWDHWHSSSSWGEPGQGEYDWGYGCSASQTSFPTLSISWLPPFPLELDLEWHTLSDAWRH